MSCCHWETTTEHRLHDETPSYELDIFVRSTSGDHRCQWSVYLKPKQDMRIDPQVGASESVAEAKTEAKRVAGELLVRLLKGIK